MRFRDDTRAVTVQIGAVLLFATLIVALSLYQATVVPSQNADVEYKHSQRVQGQMVDVRNALQQTASTGNAQTASVKLGVQYPSRVFLMNPPPATGTLETAAYANNTIVVSNVRATNNETADFLNGTWTAQTKRLAYRPHYHEYEGAAELVYGASMLYNYYPEKNAAIPLTDQFLVRGNTITLVALNGSLSTTQSGAVSVSATPLSAPHQRIQVAAKNPGEPVNVSVPTRLSAAVIRSRTSLGEQANVSVIDAGPNRVVIQLTGSTTYTLQTAKVGVGSETTNPPPHYVTLVSRTDDTVTVEVRDKFNNPESGVVVNASSEFESASKRTGTDGRVTFEVKKGQSGTGTLEILGGDVSRERVTVSVNTIEDGPTGGSNAYVVDWLEQQIDDTNPGLSCDGEICTLNASVQSSVTLFADSTPVVDGGTFEYAVSNTSIGTVSPQSNTTTSEGVSSTMLSVESNGTLNVYVSGGGSGDRLEIRVTHYGARGVVYNNDGEAVAAPGTSTQSGVQFSVTNQRSEDVLVTEIRVDPADSGIARLDDPSTSEGQFASEFFVETPGDGDTYVTDFGGGRALPHIFDLSEAQGVANDEHLIEAGETAEYTLYEFLDSGDNPVDMAGKQVEITLFFSDGTQKTFTINDGGGGGGGTNTLQYVSGSGTATKPPGPGSNSGIMFGIENTGPEEVTIRSVTIDTSAAASIQELRSGEGRFNHEVFANVEGPPQDEGVRDGYADSNGYSVGSSIELSDDYPVLGTSGDSADATIYVYEFRDSDGNAVDMSGETVTVTVTYETASGNVETTTFTFTA